jgi:hypothetical protein
MGSYDKAPDGWHEYGDSAWNPPHEIICDSRWSGRDNGGKHSHPTVDDVRECFTAAQAERKGIPVSPCSWLMEGSYDDGSRYTYECGRPTWPWDERAPGAYRCTAGHDFIPAETRYSEGWDYAADYEEAEGMARSGVFPVAMDGTAIL